MDNSILGGQRLVTTSAITAFKVGQASFMGGGGGGGGGGRMSPAKRNPNAHAIYIHIANIGMSNFGTPYKATKHAQCTCRQ